MNRDHDSITGLLQEAADAVRAYYGGDYKTSTPPKTTAAVTVPYSPTERAATAAVATAMKAGITAAQIAAVAQLRQLLVYPFIEDPADAMRALASAHWDGERYTAQVRDAQRVEAQRQVGLGRRKTDVAGLLGITRVTLDKWLDEE